MGASNTPENLTVRYAKRPTSTEPHYYRTICRNSRLRMPRGRSDAYGLTDGPIRIIYTQGAVILAMTHVLLPFAILPIQATLRSLPADLTRAAANLGASPVRSFFLITLPLSLPGVFAGMILCFVLALGFYITPALVGGPNSMMMATLIGQQTLVAVDWPFAAALSTVLLTVTLLLVVVFRKALSHNKGFNGVH